MAEWRVLGKVLMGFMKYGRRENGILKSVNERITMYFSKFLNAKSCKILLIKFLKGVCFFISLENKIVSYFDSSRHRMRDII